MITLQELITLNNVLSAFMIMALLYQLMVIWRRFSFNRLFLIASNVASIFTLNYFNLSSLSTEMATQQAFYFLASNSYYCSLWLCRIYICRRMIVITPTPAEKKRFTCLLWFSIGMFSLLLIQHNVFCFNYFLKTPSMTFCLLPPDETAMQIFSTWSFDFVSLLFHAFSIYGLPRNSSVRPKMVILTVSTLLSTIVGIFHGVAQLQQNILGEVLFAGLEGFSLNWFITGGEVMAKILDSKPFDKYFSGRSLVIPTIKSIRSETTAV